MNKENSGRVSPFPQSQSRVLEEQENFDNSNILGTQFKENPNEMIIEEKFINNSLLADITNTQQQQQQQQQLYAERKPRAVSGLSALHPSSLNKNRLIITKIVLENFKSYQGTQIIGPFHKRFTAVVGPNGSGKSNLIESLLFVFGKRATWMRLKKLNELIHNSHQHQDVRKASVEVHFQEIEDTGEGDYDFVLLQGTDFSVKRSVYHTSVSKYEINNKESSQVEVVDLLKSKGIDLNNNRFLILQGEVEQISLMKPKSNDAENPGLLEYLEDIIGSNSNKEKIESLETEYDKMQGEKRERTERVRFAEDDLKKLDESKNIAIQYVKKERQIFQMNNIVHQINRHVSNKELMINEKNQEQLAQKVKEEQKNQREKIREHEIAIKEYNRKTKARDELKKREKELEGTIKNIDAEDMKIKNEISQELEREIKTKEEIDNLSKSYQKIIDTAMEMKRLLPERRQQLTSLLAEKEDEEKKLNEVVYKVNKQGESIKNKQKKIEEQMEPFMREANKLKNKIDILNSEFNLLNSKRTDYQQEINDQLARMEKIKGSLDENKTVEDQINVATNTINRENSKALADKDSLMKELSNLNAQLAEIKSKLNDHNQSHREQERRNVVLNELIKAQQRKDLSGICGRLGDLGAIDQRFDIAITTACPALDNIVVETYEQAQRCVDYLRHYKIGRATFLNIQSTSKFESSMNKPFTAPSGAYRLFDLIKFKKPAYASVFYSALSNTLVCDDIERASQLCYHDPQRWRCVTTQGVLMEKSGVMSGGGRPRSGGMSSRISQDALSPAEIKGLTDESERIEQEQTKISEGLRLLDDRLKELHTDLEQVRKEQSRINIENDFHRTQLKDCEAKLHEYRNIMNNSNNNEVEKKSRIEREISELVNKKKEQEDNMAEFKAEIMRLEDKLSEIGGQELVMRRALVEEKNRLYEDLDKEVGKMSAMIESTGRNLKKLEKDEETAKNRLENILKKVELLKDNQKKLENEALLAIGEAKGVRERREGVEAELKSNEAEKQRIEKIVTEIKALLDKTSAEYELAKANTKKSLDDYEKANKEIEKNRKNYKETIHQYDFLEELEEIEKFKMDGVSSPNKNESALDISLNQSMHEVSTIISDNSMDPVPVRGKKIKYNIDKHYIESISVETDLPFSDLEAIEKLKETLDFKITFEQEKLKSLQPNINAIMEFKKKYFEFKEKFQDLEKVKENMNQTKGSIEQLKKERYDLFIAGYNSINFKLKETYQLLTNGGDAELELLDSLDPFSEGVVFSVRPPKKSWKQMSKLSGGEKTLSSLALVFALHYYRPTPLYFMDEIDAALDYKNVSIVGKYLKERTKNAQFIIISLRNNMFELANKLVGIYKINDTTKTVSLNPNDVKMENEDD